MGLFVPLLKQDGFKGFNLQLIIMPEKFSSAYCFLLRIN
jgi:hypothetical protein